MVVGFAVVNNEVTIAVIAFIAYFVFNGIYRQSIQDQ